jgi:hypothetical protein
MPYARMAESISREWRNVTLLLQAVPRMSPEATRLEAERANLLDEYRRLTDDAATFLPYRYDPAPSWHRFKAARVVLSEDRIRRARR